MSVNNAGPGVVGDDMVVTLNYTLTVDGDIIDSSIGSQPIEFIQGRGQIIPGLERELYGLALGDGKDVVVAAADGYGDRDPNAVADIPRDQFPPQIPLKPGTELQLRGQDGEELEAYIEDVGEETIRLNFNHPLAGKELHFSIKVVELRSATPEELAHGHVHEEGGH
jgi:FKBP-type peptidyl-prolyl cis-trans isomerase SlyD